MTLDWFLFRKQLGQPFAKERSDLDLDLDLDVDLDQIYDHVQVEVQVQDGGLRNFGMALKCKSVFARHPSPVTDHSECL